MLLSWFIEDKTAKKSCRVFRAVETSSYIMEYCQLSPSADLLFAVPTIRENCCWQVLPFMLNPQLFAVFSTIYFIT